MKKLAFLIFLALTFSCNKSRPLPNKDKSGLRIFYNEDEYVKSENRDEEFIIIDTACVNSKVKALSDIRINKLIYFHSLCPHEKELQAALKKYGISVQLGNLHSDVRVERFGDNCYEEEMMSELYRRYGQNFLDSIWNKTLEIHMKKFPNETIEENGKILKWKDVYQSLLK